VEDREASVERNGLGTDLKPFVYPDVVLVCLSVMILSSSGLAPRTVCELEGIGDHPVKNAIVFARLMGESDGECTELNAELEDTTAVWAWGGGEPFDP